MSSQTIVKAVLALIFGEAALELFCWITGGVARRIAFYTGVVPMALAVCFAFFVGREAGVYKG